jgi:nitrous oxidase accessory protein NosD
VARPPGETPKDTGRSPTLAEIAAGTVAPKLVRQAERERERREGRRGRHRPMVRLRRPRSPLWGWLFGLLLLGLVAGGAAAGGVGWYLMELGRTPREWAPYLQQRASGNHWLIVMVTGKVAGYLTAMDRLERTGEPSLPPQAGASVVRSGVAGVGMLRQVASTQQLEAALAAATPGQVIQLLPGTYDTSGRGLRMVRAGTPAAPIVLRAERLGDVTIESRSAAAFKISAPHWVVENLVVRGMCEQHSNCEHAFHVVGGGSHVVIRNNRMEDLNAQIKINGEGGAFPDHGRIEGNTMTNRAPRDVRGPITPIDLVAASHWKITGNFIADFHRATRGGATYGAFMKGAGEGTVMERNVVLCEWKLPNPRSPAVGLSVGGGGTWPDAVTRDLGASGLEQTNGVIRDNLIAFCNDVGIYVNKGRRSVVAHNTLLDTAGIGVRFAESTAEVVGNVVDGAILARDGGLLRERDNLGTPLLGLFVGLHPVRDLYRDVARLDLRWRERPAQVTIAEWRADLCGVERMGRAMPGAFEDFGACRGPSATPAAGVPTGPGARRP